MAAKDFSDQNWTSQKVKNGQKTRPTKLILPEGMPSLKKLAPFKFVKGGAISYTRHQIKKERAN